MPRTTVLIIGAGQAGLAMSRCLSGRNIDHVVLERGAVGERWRRHGWDSLRLLTPNWMTRLPGFCYRGDDPDGFMTTGELVTFLEDYAAVSHAPVINNTAVCQIERHGDGFQVSTTGATWCARAVVIATGYCDRPAVPRVATRLAPSIVQLAACDYRNPDQLPGDAVLVVGGSSTGVQLAHEIARSGRRVILATGRHTRLPRRYRGRDILWWLDRIGSLSQDASTVHSIKVSRAQPSLQLVGRPDHATIDFAVLHSLGVELTGRLIAFDQHKVQLDDDLIATTAAADLKLAALQLRLDEYIRQSGIDAPPADPFVPTWPLGREPRDRIDLHAERVKTVIWATGYRRSYRWLRVPVLDLNGEIQHRAGVTPCPGLYVLGMNFQRRRNSSFIDGVGADAEYLAHHIAGHLDRQLIA